MILRTLIVLVASAMLSSACGGSTIVLPDDNIPHMVADETVVYIWVRAPSGKYVKMPARLMEGWWIASPQLVEPGKK